MYLGIPQIIYSALIVFTLANALIKHGEPKEGEENFFSTLISVVIVLSILYWGGFFN